MHSAIRRVGATTVVALALVSAVPAVAQSPALTLRFDEPCASPASGLAYAGAGYTPGGEVTLIVGSADKFVTYTTHADATGAIAGRVPVPEPDDLLSDEEFAGEIEATGNDQTRIAQGAPPEAQFATARFRLSRFEVFAPRPVPRRRLALRAAGFVGEAGKPLYLLYRRAGRTLKTVRLGKLHGACGDLSKTVRAFPFRPVPAGAYKLVFTTSKRYSAGALSLTYTVSVKRRSAVG